LHQILGWIHIKTFNIDFIVLPSTHNFYFIQTMKFSQAEDFKRAAVFTAGKYIF
jgi:hypothetical protein